MPVKTNALSNFRTKSPNDNITNVFSTKFNGPVINAAVVGGGGGSGTSAHVANGGLVPNYRDYYADIDINGADTDTGFAAPTGAPLYATPLYGVYLIDRYNGFVTSDQAGVDASATAVFEDVTIRGVATKALSMTLKAPGASWVEAGYNKQMWYIYWRDVNVASDLPRFTCAYDLWLNDFTGKFSSTSRRLGIIDIKSGSPSNGGDYKMAVAIIQADSVDAAEFGVAVGTLGYEVVLDNEANSTGPTLTHEEFVRYKNYTTPVPTEEFFRIFVNWKRGSSYSDLTTGRFFVEMQRVGDSSRTTIADLNAASIAAYEIAHPLQCIFPTAGAPHAARPILMGERGNMIERIMFGIYGDYTNTDMQIKIANVDCYDSRLYQY